MHIVEIFNNEFRFLIRVILDFSATFKEDIEKLPVSKKCKSLLSKVVKKSINDGSDNYNDFTDEELIFLIKEFIEPVAYNDINIEDIQPFYADIHNDCLKIWRELSSEFKNKYIYENNRTHK